MAHSVVENYFMTVNLLGWMSPEGNI